MRLADHFPARELIAQRPPEFELARRTGRGHRNHTRVTVLAKEQRLRPAHDLAAADVEAAQHGYAPGRGLNAVDRHRHGLFEADLRRGRPDAADPHRTAPVAPVCAADPTVEIGRSIA